jgi:hypothetical protein
MREIRTVSNKREQREWSYKVLVKIQRRFVYAGC